MKVLLGVTGSIAAKLTSRLEKALEESGHDIKVVVTASSEHFEGPSWINPVYKDEDEWREYENYQTVLHIDLVKWADIFLIAPCTANTLTKIHLGLADNLLTCCARAWDYDNKRMIIAPAMNTQMLRHPATIDACNVLTGTRNVEWIETQEKTLYCGDTGLGAMAEISDIIECVNLL